MAARLPHGSSRLLAARRGRSRRALRLLAASRGLSLRAVATPCLCASHVRTHARQRARQPRASRAPCSPIRYRKDEAEGRIGILSSHKHIYHSFISRPRAGRYGPCRQARLQEAGRQAPGRAAGEIRPASPGAPPLPERTRNTWQACPTRRKAANICTLGCNLTPWLKNPCCSAYTCAPRAPRLGARARAIALRSPVIR